MRSPSPSCAHCRFRLKRSADGAACVGQRQTKGSTIAARRQWQRQFCGRHRPTPPPSGRNAAPVSIGSSRGATSLARTVAAKSADPVAPGAPQPSWDHLLSAWLAAHRSYPEQARRDGDTGEVIPAPHDRAKRPRDQGASGQRAPVPAN